MTDETKLSLSRGFIRNEYGLWCPNCGERIDELWPDSCDHCGYPRPGFTEYEENFCD